MFDMTKLKRRYFTMKLNNGRIIDIEAPKLKVLRKISSLSKTNAEKDLTEEDIKNLTEAVTLAFNKNKQGYKVTAEVIEENYNIKEILYFLEEYFKWINETQDSKN